jgi:hypothetical protein
MGEDEFPCLGSCAEAASEGGRGLSSVEAVGSGGEVGPAEEVRGDLPPERILWLWVDGGLAGMLGRPSPLETIPGSCDEEGLAERLGRPSPREMIGTCSVARIYHLSNATNSKAEAKITES